MTLADFEILPGVVIDSDDPLNQSRVKAVVPGVFTTENMKVEDMFWINPFFMIGKQSFSKLEKDCKIWVLHNIHNYFEYWYIPMFETSKYLPTIKDQVSEVLFARSINGQVVQMYFTQDEGTKLTIGDNYINLTPSGALDIYANKAIIKANDGGIFLGHEGDKKYCAVKAEELVKILNTFCADLSKISGVASANPYTACLANPLLEAGQKMSSELEKIKSTFVTLT